MDMIILMGIIRKITKLECFNGFTLREFRLLAAKTRWILFMRLTMLRLFIAFEKKVVKLIFRCVLASL